ncbi:MAG: glycoside hydrolase family 130 protein [Ardenticatenaceae bacterium]
MIVQRQPHRVIADPRRVIARFFQPGDEERVGRVVGRVLALPEEEVERVLEAVLRDFAHRHRDFEQILRWHYRRVAQHVPAGHELSEARCLLIGTYFTQEYSIEAAALFNPSIVLHPDQSEIAPREARVILSYRATGEGHISSVEFRSGVLSPDGELAYDPPSPFARLPEVLDDQTIRFPPDAPLSERVIFPLTSDERNGIEDVRFVRFVDDDGTVTYFGTYTAYDGHHIHPKLMTTSDFITFRLIPLEGKVVRNKGFALFPRRVRGQYVMLGRQDNENNFIMVSDDLLRWDEAHLLRAPIAPRELVQIGNNGSPIETEAGWLVLTHGVGPMRRYTLGADLLALDDPTRIIGRLEQPLLAPNESEREGYVPNVVYTCGALLHNDRLVIPYAMSDSASGVATVRLDDLLRAL